MRKGYTPAYLLAIALLLFPAFSFATLSGNYTINASASASATNYQSFASAISDLNFGTRADGGPVQGPGVSAAVVITIAAGTYTESVSLNAVAGGSNTNTITFDGVNPDTRKITSAGAVIYDHTFHLNGADYIKIRNLSIENTGSSYGYALQFENQCNFVDVTGCKISVPSYATSSYQVPVMTGNYYFSYTDAVNYLTLDDNEIKGGRFGLVLNGPSGSGSQVNTVTNNTITEVYYTAVFSYYQTLITFEGNYITLGSQSLTSGYGVSARYWNDFTFNSNTIHTVGYYGVYMYYINQTTTNRSEFSNNMIGGNFLNPSFGYGFYMSTGKNVDMFHNSILVDATGSGRALYMVGTHSGHNIQNNTFSYNGGGTGYAFYISNQTATSTMDYNNYYSNGSQFCYWGTSYANLALLKGANVNFHQNAKAVWPNHYSSTDLHVFGAAMANWANNTTSVTVDLDGDPRPYPPDVTKDVGADEYVLAPYDADLLSIPSPIVLSLGNNTVSVDIMNNGQNSLNGSSMTMEYSTNGGGSWVTESFTPTGLGVTGGTQTYSFTTLWNVATAGNYSLCVRINPQVNGDPDAADSICVNVCTGMFGAYTIDGAVATGALNYQTFDEAAIALSQCGITGPVTFTVSPGTYNEYFSIGTIPGSSSLNTVVFDGLDADSVSVEYSFSTTNQKIIELNGADHVTFRNLTVRSLGNYGFCFKLGNAADHNTIEDCKIFASTLINSVYNSAIIASGQFYYTAGNNANHLTIQNNEISGGYYSISLRGISTTAYCDSNFVFGNTISQVGYAGVYAVYQSNLEVRDNIVTGSATGSVSGSGYFFNYIEEDFYITGNVVHSLGSRGLYCSSCNVNGLGTNNIIQNNMFGANFQSSFTSYGAYMYNTRNVDFYNNSLSLGSSNGYAVYLAGGSASGNDLRNNIFSAGGPSAYALYLGAWTTVSSINYNVFNSNGATLVRVGSTNYATLALYQTAYPTFDQNSVEAKPGFVSITDLHIFCSTIDDLGTPIATVPLDIDGASRSATTPDIGADEFVGVTVNVTVGPDTSVCGNYYLELDTLVWSYFKWKGNSNKYYYTADTSGTYWVTVTDSNNCEAKDSLNIVVFDQPDEPWNQDSITICPNNIVLDALNPGAAYSWNTNATTQTIQPNTAGFYDVTITSPDGCVEYDQVYIDFNTAVSTSLGPDQTFCLGGSATMNAGQSHPLQTWLWSTGANSQVLVASAPGQYWVTVTSPQGCTATDSINVNALLPPVVNLGPDRFECDNFVLDAGNTGSTYQWQNNSTSQTQSGNTTGTYSVTVTNGAGCSATDQVLITIAATPIVNLGPDQVICNGQNVTLDAGNTGSNYLWSTGASSQTINVSTPGIYIVEVENATSGCKGYDTLSITGSSLVVNLGPDDDICANQPYTLNAGNPGNTYAWSTGASTQTIQITTPGTVTVTVTDGIGCSASSSITLTQGAPVTAGFAAVATTPLFQPITFADQSTGGATTWLWDFGDGTTSTQQNPTHVYVAMGNFNVCLTSDNGACDDTYCDDLTIAAPVGIEDEDFVNGISIYPNPSNGIFNIGMDFAQAFDVNIEIMDLTGRIVYKTFLEGVSQRTEAVDISGNAAGIYLVKVTEAEGRQQIMKIILE